MTQIVVAININAQHAGQPPRGANMHCFRFRSSRQPPIGGDHHASRVTAFRPHMWRPYAFRPANAALRSQSDNAVRSSCAARDGTIGRRL